MFPCGKEQLVLIVSRSNPRQSRCWNSLKNDFCSLWTKPVGTPLAIVDYPGILGHEHLLTATRPILEPRLLLREKLGEPWLSQNFTTWRWLFSTTKRRKCWCEEERRMCKKHASLISIDAKNSPSRRTAVQISSRTLWPSAKGITNLGPEWAWPHSVWEPWTGSSRIPDTSPQGPVLQIS